MTDPRFAFGKNWSDYITTVNEERIQSACRSLEKMLGAGTIAGKSFLDIGCGSGLFSLAALRLGAARIHSFDYDRDSVSAATVIKQTFAPHAGHWTIEQGSALDSRYLEQLGQFDIVYSWGVLHHTGNMWQALELAIPRIAPGGKLFIALYNDQGAISTAWKVIKRTYHLLPPFLRPMMAGVFFIRFWLLPSIKDVVRLKPFATLRTYRSRRGMSAWHDVVDWIGGYPFEIASADRVTAFCAKRGLKTEKSAICRGHGCSEFVFTKSLES